MKMLFRIGFIAAVAALAQMPASYAQTPTAPPAAPSTTPAAPEAAPPPPPPPVAAPGFVFVGPEKYIKPATGRVSDVEKGDNGCYVVIVDIKNREFIELGAMELCTQKPPLKGKKVALEYRMESIPAASCGGNPKCTAKEMTPYLSSVKVVD